MPGSGVLGYQEIWAVFCCMQANCRNVIKKPRFQITCSTLHRNYISFIHHSQSKRASPLPLSHQQSGQGRWVLCLHGEWRCTDVESCYMWCSGVCYTLLFLSTCSLWLMQLPPMNLLPVSWSCQCWWPLHSAHTLDCTHPTSACLHDECVTAAHHVAMWCTGVCCLVVATTMLLQCTSILNAFPSLSSLSPKEQVLFLSATSKAVQAGGSCVLMRSATTIYIGVYWTLLFLFTCSLWLMQLLPAINHLPVSWSLHVTPMCIVHAPCTCKVVFAHSVPTLYYSTVLLGSVVQIGNR